MSSTETNLNLTKLPAFLASTLTKVRDEENLVDELCSAVLSGKGVQIVRHIATQLVTLRGTAVETDGQVQEL